MTLAGLACGGGTNVQATVDAVDTAVQTTLNAMTQPASGSPAPATSTPAPTLGVVTQPPPTAVAATQPAATSGPPSATLTPAPTSEQPVRPNGPMIHAIHFASPPTIDAQGSEWPSSLPDAIDQLVFQAPGFNGPFNQSGRFAMGWDANNLYLYVVILDAVHVQTQHGETMFQGDSLEIQFDADLGGDFAGNRIDADDFQLGLSPGENRDAPEAFLWNPAARKGVPAGIVMASRAGSDAGGYVFEAAIPWTFFGVSPVPGEHFGLAVNSSDDDAPGTAIQQSMISSVSTRKLLDPTSWGTLQLDP